MLIDEALSFPNETTGSLSSRLQGRLSARSSSDEVAATSQRLSARSEHLREQHIAAVKERAARETQRAEEAAARKRRREALCAAVQAADGVPMPLKSRQDSESPLAPTPGRSSPTPGTDSPAPICSTPRPAAETAERTWGCPSTSPASAPAASVAVADPMAAVGPPSSGLSPRRSVDGSNMASLGLSVAPPPLEQPGAALQITPRNAQSPRRQPEMPTIVEVCRAASLSLAGGRHTPAAALPDAPSLRRSMALTRLPLRGPQDPAEDDYSPERPPRNLLRSFERQLYAVELTGGRTGRCYEIRWADGSSRRVFV